MEKNIVFIGMPAAGKSTIGVVVAKRLGYDFIDTDLCIQSQEKRLLCEIIEQEGNERFREIENQVNRDLVAERAVISPGGSVVYCEEAMEHFKETSVIVYLRISYEEIMSRLKDIKQRGVSIKEGQTMKDLYEERSILFEKYADIIVDGHNGELEKTTEKVLEEVKKYL